MKEMEIVTIGKKDYCIVREVEEDNIHYVFISNVVNPEDIMIRKSSLSNPDLYIPLENEDEYYLANLLLFRESYEQ